MRITSTCFAWLLLCLSLRAHGHEYATSDSGILRQARTVVVGQFTGEEQLSLRHFEDLRDREGNLRSESFVITSQLFRVTETLAGTSLGDLVWVNRFGGVFQGVETAMSLDLPEIGSRCVLALVPDSRSDRAAQVVVHGRSFPATTDEQLSSLRTQVEVARRETLVDPQRRLEDAWEERARDLAARGENIPPMTEEDLSATDSGDVPEPFTLEKESTRPRAPTKSGPQTEIRPRLETDAPDGNPELLAFLAASLVALVGLVLLVRR